MRINKNELIAGQGILRVRDYLRHFTGDPDHLFEKGHVAYYFKVPERRAAQIIRELKARGWIEPAKGKYGKEGYCSITMGGTAFTAARAVPPINRAKAERLLAECLKRIEDVNKRNELSHYVREAWLFGSLLNERAKDYGDIDIALDVQYRERPGIEPWKYMEERAGKLKPFMSWIDRLAWVESEVRRLIKARNPYIS